MESRANSRSRGYDNRWDKAAATFKRRHPCCLGCAAIGKHARTEVVDHVEPHKGDQIKFWNTALWQPACAWHHNAIKPELERLFFLGQASVDDLWLNSELAKRLSNRKLPPTSVDKDGWPA